LLNLEKHFKIESVEGLFVKKLKSALEERGMTAYQLAKKTKLSQGHVYNLLNGNRPPTEDAIEEIAPAIGVAVEEMLSWLDLDRLGENGLKRILKYSPEAIPGLEDYSIGDFVRSRADHGAHPLVESETLLIAEAEDLGVWTSYLDEPELWDESPEERAWVFNLLENLISEGRKAREARKAKKPAS
jgi:transcriptional regulator with XRE-family HTH domain